MAKYMIDLRQVSQNHYDIVGLLKFESVAFTKIMVEHRDSDKSHHVLFIIRLLFIIGGYLYEKLGSNNSNEAHKIFWGQYWGVTCNKLFSCLISFFI